MTTIELVANDQLLQVTVSPKISSGEVNTVSIHVDFSDEWNNFGKNAVFYTSYNSRDIYEIVMTNDECIVPSEVMTKSGTLYIGIRGVNSEENEVKTTSLVKLKISEGTPTGNSTEVEPTPDVYQQLLTAYGKTDNSIKVEKAERQAEIAVERARIDNISTLTEGSTTGDAELLDIRVKADGTTATSAGNAVREQVSELKGDLIEDINKLWIDFPYTKGYYLNSAGLLSTRETSYITGFIPVKGGQKIQVSGYAGNVVTLYAFYSDTQYTNMISAYVPEVYGHYTQIAEVPEGANYIVACSFVDTDRFFVRIICDYGDLIEVKEKASNTELLLNDKTKYGNHLKKPFDFTNKTSVWFGDSITMGVTSPNLEVTNENYPTLFASYVGASALFNNAVSGSCIADSDSQYSILNKILNYSNGAKDFTFVAGGTNDYTTGKQVGTFGDTTADTFYGALHLICEHLKTNDRFVNSTVIFITPINQNKNRDNPNAIESINTYRNAIYEVATSYGFNVIDGSQIGFPTESGGFADELCTDGVHPTQKGHEYYARALCGILM